MVPSGSLGAPSGSVKPNANPSRFGFAEAARRRPSDKSDEL